VGDNKFEEKNMYFADSNFFKFFTFLLSKVIETTLSTIPKAS